ELHLRGARLRDEEPRRGGEEPREGGEVDQGILADRARQQGRSADRPVLRRRQGRQEGRLAEGPTHSPPLGMLLEEKLKPLGVDVVLVYPGRPSTKYKSIPDYLIQHLLK